MDPLPGDPDALLGYTGRFARIAEQIRDTSKTLQDIANDEEMIGRAIAQVRARVSEASSAILAAEPRYTETSQALAEYAVRLEDAQQDAQRAIADLGSDPAQMHRLENERQRLRLRLLGTGLDADELREITTDIRVLDRRIQVLESSIDAAVRAYQRAERDRDDAAEAAIRRIQNVLERGADSFWDDLTGAWENFTDILGDIADWIWNVALPVLIDIVLVIELVVLAVVVIVVGLGLVVFLLTNPWLVPGLVLMLQGVDTDALIDDLIAGASAVIPLVSLWMQMLLLREAMTPTPPLTPLTPPGGETSSSEEPYYDHLFDELGQLDADGGSDETHIEIVEIINADGSSSWRVVLPSTQDWELANGALDGDPQPTTDQGGVNDLGSNLALMLTPEQEAAYQRAVYQAMHDAGIGDNDPVMLVGWSQGGILAGRMACDPNAPGDVQAIVVAGAPIDAMPIPDSVNVLSVQHEGDIVPRLDGQPANTSTSNWVTVSGRPDVEPMFDRKRGLELDRRTYTGMSSHDASLYSDSARYRIDESTEPAIRRIIGENSRFFGSDERVNIYSTAE
ncbi:hypothetical protein BH09ACT3_BH09ACT3_16830 [soil metagenome]